MLRALLLIAYITMAAASSITWGGRLVTGVTSSTRGSLTTVTFTEGCTSPITVSADVPFKRNGGCSKFKVKLPIKGQRTAVGLQFSKSPASSYLTPSYSPSLKSYVSFGGAGYIYPATVTATRGYKEKDEIEISIDWSAQKVDISVNSGVVGTVALDPGVDSAWPSVSSEGGIVVAEITTKDS